jgi:hypothetical protein
MTAIWFALAIIAGIVLIVDLVTTQLRKRARRAPFTRQPTQKEGESDVPNA